MVSTHKNIGPLTLLFASFLVLYVPMLFLKADELYAISVRVNYITFKEFVRNFRGLNW